ncbi:MAG: nucleoside-diphosphate kinase [Planctomycetota bacterium]|jgi:nucleoside-diphosphate kinase
MQKTLTIIKPDAVSQGLAGRIIARMEEEGLKVVAMKMIHLSKEEARGFYHVHREKPFFDSLTDFMSSGPCIPMVLEGNDAIERLRELMGATDPKKAEKNTLRALYATNVERNAVHGSDAPETAAFEMGYFFNHLEIKDYTRDGGEGENKSWEPLPPLT